VYWQRADAHRVHVKYDMMARTGKDWAELRDAGWTIRPCKAEDTQYASKHTFVATPEHDSPKTCYRLEGDTKLPIRVWLVWVMMLDKSVVLRAVTTTEERAKMYAKAARQSVLGNVLHARVEPSALNHLYGGMMYRRL
jgi:hypothetical protein